MRERVDGAECMGEWDEGDRRGQSWMNQGVGTGKEKEAGLDGCGSEMRKKGRGQC